jgi:hypothetical protein
MAGLPSDKEIRQISGFDDRDAQPRIQHRAQRRVVPKAESLHGYHCFLLQEDQARSFLATMVVSIREAQSLECHFQFWRS